jgi:hypothetical protein
MIFGVEDGRLARGRVYLESFESGEETWQAVHEAGWEGGTN